MTDKATRPLDDEDKHLLGLISDGGEGFIHEVLAGFGLAAQSIERTKVGNNNSCFIVTVSERDQSSRRIGYDAGTYPIPPLSAGEKRRVVFTSAQLKEDMNAALMSANKVAAMKLVHDAGGLASTITPHVYGWSDGKAAGIGAGKSWCLMEFMPGVVLSTLWDGLDDAKKLSAVQSIARVLKSLQEVPLPKSSHPYGAFTFADFKQGASVVVGETCFHYGGPFKHVRNLYAGQILKQWEAVVQRAPRLDKWSGSNVTLRSGRQIDLGKGLEELVKIVEEDGAKWKEMTKGFEVPPGLIHGDFSKVSDVLELTTVEMNFLVDPETLHFTGLLDFEFAQSGPPIDEYFQSLPTQGLIYLGERPSNMDPEGVMKRQQAALRKDAMLPADCSAELRQNFAYISAFKLDGVYGPWSMDPEVLEREAGLYWFGYELCNGPFQRETFWTNTDERSVKRREKMMKEVRMNMEWDVKTWLD